MKKLLSTLLVLSTFVAFATILMPISVSAGPTAPAKGSSVILPNPIEDLNPTIVTDNKKGDTIAKAVTNAMTIMFIVVFIVAVFYTFMAAIKYIRSEGNEQKVEEAKNAVKAVLFGVAAMFIAIIGILLINAFFGGNGGTGLGTAIDDLLAPIQN